MSQPRYAATCEAPPPEVRDRRRSSSRRRVKRRSPAPLHRERATDLEFRPRPRPFDLDEIEQRDEDKRHRLALLKAPPMARRRSNSTGNWFRSSDRARDYRDDSSRQGREQAKNGNLTFLKHPPHRHSADSARPSMSEITGDSATASLFEPLFVRVEELDPEPEKEAATARPPSNTQVPGFIPGDEKRPSQRPPSIVPEIPVFAVDDRREISELLQFCVRNLVTATACCRQRSASQTPNGQKAWEQVAETLSEHSFALDVWASEAQIAGISPDTRREESIRTVEVALRRLGLRSSRILGLISNGSPRLFPIPEEVKLADVDRENSDDEKDSKLPAAQLTPSRQMAQEIKGLTLQLRTLRRLTRCIRDTQESDGMAALASHISEVQDLFGSDAAIKRHGVGGDLPADAALKQARECAAHSSTALTIPTIVVS